MRQQRTQTDTEVCVCVCVAWLPVLSGLARHWFSLGIPIPAMRQKWTIEQELNVLVVTQTSVFVLWQVARIFVGKHFVASYHNLYARPWSLFLAPLSHADVFQLIVNVFAYLTFSPELRRSLGAVAFYRSVGDGCGAARWGEVD